MSELEGKAGWLLSITAARNQTIACDAGSWVLAPAGRVTLRCRTNSISASCLSGVKGLIGAAGKVGKVLAL